MLIFPKSIVLGLSIFDFVINMMNVFDQFIINLLNLHHVINFESAMLSLLNVVLTLLSFTIIVVSSAKSFT
jgi:hypothetical protein